MSDFKCTLSTKDILGLIDSKINKSILEFAPYKARIMRYRRDFYASDIADSSIPRIDRGQWFKYNEFSALDMQRKKYTGSFTEELGQREDTNNQTRSNMKWSLTRRLGEPLIANVTRPFIEEKNNVAFSGDTDRNTTKIKVLSKIVEKENERQDKIGFMKDVVRRSIVDGVSFVKMGHKSEDNTYSTEISEELYNSLKTASKNSDMINVSKKHGKYILLDDTNIDVSLTREVIDPLRIHMDTEHELMEDKNFFCVMDTMTIGDIIDNFNASEKRNKLYDIAKNNYDYLFSSSSRDSNEVVTLESTLTVYDIWIKLDYHRSDDKKSIVSRMTNLIIVSPTYRDNIFTSFLEGYDDKDKLLVDIIMHRESPYIFNKIPFVRSFGFDSSSKEFGDGISEFTQENQQIEQKIINASFDVLNSNLVGKIAIRKGALDKTSKTSLTSNSKYIELNPSNRAISQDIHEFTFKELPPTIFKVIDMIDKNSQEVTGVNDTMTGAMGASVNASTSNFSAGLSMAETRTAMIIANIKDMLESSFLMWGNIASIIHSEETIMKLVNISIEGEFARYAEDKYKSLIGDVELGEEDRMKILSVIIDEEKRSFYDINIECDVSISVASEASKNMRIASILNIAQQARELNKSLPPEILNEFVSELARLQGFRSIANKIDAYNNTPNEVQQQFQELEIAEKTANIELTQAETEKAKALAQNSVERATALSEETQRKAYEGPHKNAKLQLENERQVIENVENEKRVIDANTQPAEPMDLGSLI